MQQSEFGAYPRPHMRRDTWFSLDGDAWDYAIVAKGESSGTAPLASCLPRAWDGKIRVPFSPEAPASGVGRQLLPDQVLWYRRTVNLGPVAAGQRILLHFDAVDWACDCWVNGAFVGSHQGAYERFSFDVTDAVGASPEGSSFEIVLRVADPSDMGPQPRGKQRLNAKRVWYTAQSGIWGPVWLELVPSSHVEDLFCAGDAAASAIDVRVLLSGAAGHELVIRVLDGDAPVASSTIADAGGEARCRLVIPEPHLWSPDDPHLYRVLVCYGEDRVEGYCALRTVTVAPDDRGIPRFCLNGQPLMLRGVLDQGYWESGLMTPPSDDALVDDVLVMRKIGFNMLRKHVKVESERYYWHCDRLGMLVCQDLVPGGDRIHLRVAMTLPSRIPWFRRRFPDGPLGQMLIGSFGRARRDAWRSENLRLVEDLCRHPSIVMWTVFNEGWGQFDSRRVVGEIARIDPTRPIDAASGWFDRGGGDFVSVHDYRRGLPLLHKALERLRRHRDGRALVLSEFGGATLRVEGHCDRRAIFGYGACADAASFAQEFRRAIDEVEGLWDEGLSGYVYTQLSDVESELNGILTFDRAVNKLDIGC